MKTSWEPVANWYDDLLAGDDTYQAKVILPNLVRLVEPAGKKILDIACGQGFFSKAFVEAGAPEVLGVDISPELIKIAKAGAIKSGTKNLQFEVSKSNKISAAKDSAFDAAVIVLALQNIKELAETIKEAQRALVTGGKLVIVLNHPFFRIPKASAWGFDESAGVQYRRIDKYGTPFSTEIEMNPGAEPAAAKTSTISFHRPLQDYFKALTGAGFSVVGLEEWISHKKSQAGPRAKAEDQARKEFPLFLTIVAKK